MLWLALHFRLLPLEVHTRAEPAMQARPYAIAAAPGAQAELIAVNAAAQRLGVRTGMSVATAGALASMLQVVPRDSGRELAMLRHVAAWSLQYTPLVSLAPPADVLLEIEGSLHLFGGLVACCRRLQHELRALGLEAVIACAPTPLAAQWFAHAGISTRIEQRSALRQALESLPISLPMSLLGKPGIDVALQRYGVRDIAGCLQLPRAGLARRGGQALLDALDRALGLVPDPRLPFIPPQTHHATLPLPAPASSSEALLFAARRLLRGLCGWLTAIGCGVERPQFAFSHEKLPATAVTLKLAAASRDPEHLTTLLRERLARVTLPCAVVEIALHSGRVTPLASQNTTFLPDSVDSTGSAQRFMEKLHARLGDEALVGLMSWHDHRPEHAWRPCPPGTADDGGGETADDAGMRVRPLWLLASPKLLHEVDALPCDGEPLSLISGPERIEAGWWESQHSARDYYVARNAAQALLWIYREHGGAAHWYVHGVFA